MRARRFVIFLLMASFGAACGVKGPLLPPVRLVPLPPEGMTVLQRGERLILEWSLPMTYIDGSDVDALASLEIGEAEKAGDFPDNVKSLKILDGKSLDAFRLPGEAKPVRYSIAIEDLQDRIGRPCFFALRVRDARRKRDSDWSPPVSITPLVASEPPGLPRLAVFENRVEVRWDAPAEDHDKMAPAKRAGYNIYRMEKGGEPKKLNPAVSVEPLYDDRAFEFDRTYVYFVRAVLGDAAPYVESLDSPAAEITPKDTFPPRPPSGLAAAAGSGVITLLWDASPERDVAGYRIWRRGPGGKDAVLLTPQPIPENTFTDATAAKGPRYAYSVSAVDKNGNESPRSVPVIETLKEKRP